MENKEDIVWQVYVGFGTKNSYSRCMSRVFTLQWTQDVKISRASTQNKALLVNRDVYHILLVKEGL